ncbi:N-acetylmuramoyl-L-alanine amidase [uncultured Eubacterium sp.]|jgi:N-acetylmuramoyl-L-alanine amidase|uniref:N-acetylmuramoyl-L-alanine amidase family protein n=2 Tax=Eubacterium TaxID=1730 RepID=UPI00267099C1|nr:N-acetylmuramoyl-L-alanine amidase [uncultured Eubacterium sp.]
MISVKSYKKMEIFMAIILLVSVTAIACNMEKVVKEPTKEKGEVVTTKKINGKTVVIDPGHGGDDPGKIGVNKEKEKDVNLAISKKLFQVLNEQGYKVVLTRSEDVVLGDGDKFSKISDLNKRCEIINNAYEENNKCIMVSIHQNSFTQTSVHGAQSFYFQRSEQSKLLGETLQKILNEKVNEKEKKAKPNDSYYILINSKCPGIIVECGFLSNSDEATKLTNETYQKELAEILSEGISTYFNMQR